MQRIFTGVGLASFLASCVCMLTGCGSDQGSGPDSQTLENTGAGGSEAVMGAGGTPLAPLPDPPSPSSSGAAGSEGNEGNPDVSGVAGAAGTGGANGAAGSGQGGTEAQPVDPGPRPFFSFFVTSQAGLFGLPAGQSAPAPDPVNGFGGNLGGLAGADEICTALARQSNPGDTKVWRAFLSTAGVSGGTRVDAIDRIGPGPWYDFNGRKLADDVAGLMPEGNDGRPADADPELADMFTDENGEDARPNMQIDNHDTLTGSNPQGRLFDDGDGGRVATCEDWTSSTLRGMEANAFGMGGQIPVGHSWPRSATNGRQWVNDHTINGCEAGFDIDGGGGAEEGDFRVGAGGGYGGIYCFALGAIAPE
jgi:hypothetical protein